MRIRRAAEDVRARVLAERLERHHRGRIASHPRSLGRKSRRLCMHPIHATIRGRSRPPGSACVINYVPCVTIGSQGSLITSTLFKSDSRMTDGMICRTPLSGSSNRNSCSDCLTDARFPVYSCVFLQMLRTIVQIRLANRCDAAFASGSSYEKQRMACSV
jgi:hypothetical protein